MRAFRLEQTDQDEFTLHVYGELELETEGRLAEGATGRLTMTTGEAVELLEAAEAGIGGYVAEMRRERAAFDRATPEERRAVIGPGHAGLENLAALSASCHAGRHAECEHHQPGGPHDCECACHLR